jgi:hypothetical protein
MDPFECRVTVVMMVVMMMVVTLTPWAGVAKGYTQSGG